MADDLLISNSQTNNENTEVSNVEPSKSAKKKYVGNLPTDDLALSDLALVVATAWLASGLRLLTTTPQILTAKATALNAASLNKDTLKGKRSGKSEELKACEDKINRYIEYVKYNIMGITSKSTASSYYQSYGIVRNKKGSFKIPTDVADCKQSLQMLISALTANKIDQGAYGVETWTKIYNDYVSLTSDVNKSSSGVSKEEGTKTSLSKDIRLILNSVVFLIKANYPLTWKTELRAWGFLKENY